MQERKEGKGRLASAWEEATGNVKSELKMGAQIAGSLLLQYVGNAICGFSEESEEKPRSVSRSDKKKYQEAATQCLNRIDAFYRLEKDTPWGKWLKECAQLKAELPSLRAAGEAAQKVLGIYYQSGRIRDTLEKLDAFSQGVHAPSTPELARIKGYNNYCSLLMQDVAALGRVTFPNIEEVQPGKKVVDAFLREECARMDFWKDIPEVRELCQGIDKGLIDPGNAHINQICPILRSLKENPEPALTQEMIDRLESMRNRNKALRSNIDEAREICDRLLPRLTEEWFRKLDPDIEDNPINQMNVDEILQLYREALSGLLK